jgi:uncharacterized membrane protein YhaH (DUF805 family)
MDMVHWPTFIGMLSLATIAGLICVGRSEIATRLDYAAWLIWATLIFPSGHLLLALGIGDSFPVLLWTYLALHLGQVFVLGAKTAMRFQDAGLSRWFGLLMTIPVLGMLPGVALAFVPPARTERGAWALPSAPTWEGNRG